MPRLGRRSVYAAVYAVVATAVLVPLTPAAADAGTTSVTFAISSGSLSISVPASANLGSGTPGGTITSALGAVTVTDTRANLVSTWTATVSSTNYTTGGGTAHETIPATALSYFSGTATTTGSGLTLTGLTIGAVNALTMPASGSAAITVAALTAGTGNNTATWNPTLIVNVPSAAVAGTYSGTVTHSVA